MRTAFAPEGERFAVCPHCWEFNVQAVRLCGRCGADMHLVLQESGGARRTAPVQSPVPVRTLTRLPPLQRILLLCFILALLAVHVIGALYASARRLVVSPAAASPVTPAGAAAGLE